MVHSTWGDWLVREEIEAVDPEGLSVWYLGCNGYVLRTAEATVYLDPYFGDGEPPRIVRMIPVPMDPADATLCDAVFVTHEHIDHMHPPSYRALVDDLGADLYAPGTAYDAPDYDGDVTVGDARKNVVEPGDAIEVGDLTVHVRGANDPDAAEPVTYVVEHEAGTFFAGGDTRPWEGFGDVASEFDLDLGVLAYGTAGNVVHTEDEPAETRVTEWYNDGTQLSEAVNRLELDRFAPVHWDMWRGVSADPKSLHEDLASFEYPRVVEVLGVGDRLEVGRPGVIRPKAMRDAERPE